MIGTRTNRWYHATAIFSVLFALAGFSYNVWRMEVSEQNNSVREASFEILLQLADLEQLVYAAHYDNDAVGGNPRSGWVKVGLVVDLSAQAGEAVASSAANLRTVWGDSWASMHNDKQSVEQIVAAIDRVRERVRLRLSTLD